MVDLIQNFLSKQLIKYLSGDATTLYTASTHTFEMLQSCIRPGDVLLVEGKQRFSVAIKYLTQSNWSHSALYIGDDLLVEADIQNGVQKIPLNHYQDFHTRICRPMGLDQLDLDKVLSFCVEKLGHQYDLKNIIDLARYLIPRPPVPDKWKRKLLRFGSGDPTKVICSSLIADAFHSVKYPILPLVKKQCPKRPIFSKSKHATLFTPSDFDRSPYFQVIKPTLESRFEYKKIQWTDLEEESPN